VTSPTAWSNVKPIWSPCSRSEPVRCAAVLEAATVPPPDPGVGRRVPDSRRESQGPWLTVTRRPPG
jgi:hypothetical protein